MFPLNQAVVGEGMEIIYKIWEVANPWDRVGQAHDMLTNLSVNPLTLKISLVFLLTVCQVILTMLVWRIWYRIN